MFRSSFGLINYDKPYLFFYPCILLKVEQNQMIGCDRQAFVIDGRILIPVRSTAIIRRIFTGIEF